MTEEIKKKRISRYEMETHIHFNEEEDAAEIMTYNGRLIRKLMNAVKKHPQEFKFLREDKEWGSFFRATCR